MDVYFHLSLLIHVCFFLTDSFKVFLWYTVQCNTTIGAFQLFVKLRSQSSHNTKLQIKLEIVSTTAIHHFVIYCPPVISVSVSKCHAAVSFNRFFNSYGLRKKKHLAPLAPSITTDDNCNPLCFYQVFRIFLQILLLQNGLIIFLILFWPRFPSILAVSLVIPLSCRPLSWISPNHFYTMPKAKIQC